MENQKKSSKKANVIASIVEVLILLLYGVMWMSALDRGSRSGNLAQMFEEVVAGIWILNISMLILAIVCLTVKAMRTNYTVRMSVWNMVWAIGNIYFLCL